MAEKTFEPPDWKPLEQLVGPEGCGEFMWMWARQESSFTNTSAHAVICCSIPKAGVTSVGPAASSRQMFKLS